MGILATVAPHYELGSLLGITTTSYSPARMLELPPAYREVPGDNLSDANELNIAISLWWHE